MRATHYLALLGCLFFSADGRAQRLPHDHYDPVLLNEFAVAKAGSGDLTTAWIMLERAARLAPHDPRIRHNLAELRALRAGLPAPAAIADPAQMPRPLVDKQAPGMLPEPPPIWPPR